MRLLNDLPPELLERVLALLPVQTLCRLRLVCKTWNRVLTQPGFTSLCPSILITRKFTKKCSMMALKQDLTSEWKLLDMAEKRFYTLNDSFICDYMLSGSTLGDEKGDYSGWFKYTLAADGGLIYLMYLSCRTGFRRHIVCNPVSQTFHHIRAPDVYCSYDTDIVVMSVDYAKQSYKIVTIHRIIRSTPREQVLLYDSTTMRWRELCKVPENHTACSSIFLKGMLYTLLLDTCSEVPWCPKLYSCDLVTGKWRSINVAFPQPPSPLDQPLLVMSLGRLFLLEYTALPTFQCNDMALWEIMHRTMKKKHVIKVSIWELIGNELDRKLQVTKVAEMANYMEYMLHVGDLVLIKEQRPQGSVLEINGAMGDAVVAHGCGDSIVVSSLLGRCVEFDLVKRCWYELPGSSGHMYDINHRGTTRQGIFAGLIHPDLRKMKSC